MLTRTAATNVGLVRPINEDRYICLAAGIYVVADGMGGHAAGEVASGLLVETARELLDNAGSDAFSEDSLKQVILQANQKILAKASQDKRYAGMGTTASILQIREDAGILAHVGDSRIYLFRAGNMQQLTKDHSLVWDLVENGTITAAEAKQHPKRNLLTRAVGVDPELEVDASTFSVDHGDKFLLCSDGLTNMVSEEAIQATVLDPESSNKAQQLVDLALRAGGTDNITAIVVEKSHA